MVAIMVAVVTIAVVSASTAAPLDGSVPIVCAGTEILECNASGTCPRRSAEEINLPVLLRVDVEHRVLSSLDRARTAPIHAVERKDGRLVLHGGQEGRGWTAVIVEASGKLSATVVDDEAGFVIFGACGAPAS
jgi:hypothetical protein